jgi:TRAP-type mannitol/chloroaromatic compound transport system substrate-binding protein
MQRRKFLASAGLGVTTGLAAPAIAASAPELSWRLSTAFAPVLDNANFRTIWDSMRAFRGEEYLWFQFAEYPFDNFMIRARAKGG